MAVTSKRIVILILYAYLLVLNASAIEFSLKINGGWGWTDGGDLNKSISGWRQYYEDRQSPSFSSIYSVREMHCTYEVGAEVMVKISSRWSIGLGTSFLPFSQNGEISTKYAAQQNYTISPSQWGTVSVEETTSQSPSYEIEAVPITLSAYYLLPLGEKYDLCLGGGGGLYLSRYRYKEEYSYRFNYTDDQYSANSSVQYVDRYSTAGEYSETAETQAFGLHAAAALDVRISPSFFITLEVLGRWVNLDGWEGEKADSYDWTHIWGLGGGYSDKGTEEESYDGRLWRVDVRSGQTGKSYPRLVFSQEEPVSVDYAAVKPANINLSGISARIGFKFKFGKSG